MTETDIHNGNNIFYQGNNIFHHGNKSHADNDKVTISIFTDPMMGLSYECEPIFRKLETHFPDVLNFKYVMSLLVKDIHDFMTWDELSREPEEKFLSYNKRLAGIYLQEEKITGMPMNMEGFNLFDEDHTTTLPLNLACKAVLHIAPEKEEQFLYNVRYATIVETRQTTRFDEILKVVRQTGIDEKAFTDAFNSQEVREAFLKDLAERQSLGIHGLPAYLIEYQGKKRLINTLIGYESFVSIIKDITNMIINPQKISPCAEAVRELLERHPLICSVELMHAFDLKREEEVKDLIEPLLGNGEITIEHVHHGWFVRKTGKSL